MYKQEHKDFFAALRAGKPINDMENAAKSSLIGILGREACYSGKRIEWNEMMTSNLTMAPKQYDWGSNPVRPIPMPGVKQSV